jgi:hypothetical protein
MELLELLADFFPIIVPAMACIGLVAAQTAHIPSIRGIAMSIFYGTLVVVALGTIRSMAHNEGTWLLHAGSLGMLIIGASIIMISAAPQNATE